MFLCDFVWYWRCFQTKKLKKWMMEIKRTSWSLSDMSMNLNAEQTQNSVRGREDDLFGNHVVMRRTVVWRWNLVPHQTDSVTFQKSHIEVRSWVRSCLSNVHFFHSLHNHLWHTSVICTHNPNTMNKVQEGLSESVCRYPCIYMINHVEPLFMTAGSISRPSSVPVQNAMNMFTSSVVAFANDCSH